MIVEQWVLSGREEGRQEGRHLGGKAFAIEHILEVLNERFQVNVVAMLTPALEAIDDLDVFKGLLRSASAAEHLEDFVRTLENCVNGTQ